MFHHEPGLNTARAVGVAIFLVACSAFSACGRPDIFQCARDALDTLPRDPQMVTPYDIEAVAKKLQACHGATDAGVK